MEAKEDKRLVPIHTHFSKKYKQDSHFIFGVFQVSFSHICDSPDFALCSGHWAPRTASLLLTGTHRVSFPKQVHLPLVGLHFTLKKTGQWRGSFVLRHQFPTFPPFLSFV